MAKKVALHQLSDLSCSDSPKEILLDTDRNTELHVIKQSDGKTIIRLPYGNRVDFIDGVIVIHPKY